MLKIFAMSYTLYELTEFFEIEQRTQVLKLEVLYFVLASILGGYFIHNINQFLSLIIYRDRTIIPILCVSFLFVVTIRMEKLDLVNGNAVDFRKRLLVMYGILHSTVHRKPSSLRASKAGDSIGYSVLSSALFLNIFLQSGSTTQQTWQLEGEVMGRGESKGMMKYQSDLLWIDFFPLVLSLGFLLEQKLEL